MAHSYIEERLVLLKAWERSQRKDPCDLCGAVGKGNNPTCKGQNLCGDCWEKAGRPVVQIYPGDYGYGLPIRGS